MKVGTIGTSVITTRMIDALKNTGNEVNAVYSRSEAKAKEFADTWGAPKAYSDLDAMLKNADIDTIYVASPNSLHYEQAKKALEAGKHVIGEKPFTSTVEQAKELYALAEEKGLYIFEAITTIHLPNYKAIAEAIKEGRIGNPKVVTGNYSQYSSRYTPYLEGKVTNIFDPAFDGGALQDINVYNIHFITGLFGKPETVTYYPNKGFNGIDTSGMLVLQYPGFTALAVGAKDCSAPCEVWLEGDKATIGVLSSPGQVRTVRYYPPKGDMTGKKDADTSQDMGIVQNANHMDYEAADFKRIIEEDDRAAYEALKAQTLVVAEILEEAKRQRDAK